MNAVAEKSVDQGTQAVFKPCGETLRKFMLDTSFLTIIQGPWGSGKSVAALMKLYMLAMQQEPSPIDGKRKTRWVIVRNTYGELTQTTIKTWLDWFPEHMYGKFKWSKPMTHHIRIGDVDAEFVFLALDDEDDRKKLLSYEFTGFFVNECREVLKEIIDDLSGRAGRYPSKRDGGPTWHGGICDTNAPSEDHWLPIMRGDVLAPDWMSEEETNSLKAPPNWAFYNQPGGILEKFDARGELDGYIANPLAENVENLPGGHDYYLNNVGGKKRSWININYRNILGSHRGGKAVWENYREEVHLAREPIEPIEGVDVWVGLDFGRQQAAIYAQQLHGRWLIVGESIGMNIGSDRFAPIVKRDMARLFPWVFARPGEERSARAHFFGDPSGDDAGQADDNTPFLIFRKHGMMVRKAPGGNGLSIRLQAVEKPLDEMKDGKPRILISPRCVMLKGAMNGGYHYAAIKGQRDRYNELPAKDKFSHPADAFQYLMLGGGEGRAVLMGSERPKSVDTRREYRRGERGRRSLPRRQPRAR